MVTALDELRTEFPRRFGKGDEAHLPAFRWESGRLIAREQIQQVLQMAAAAVGLPPERFRSHSLRASAMLHATNQFDLVKRFGRWSRDAVLGYLHDSAEQSMDLASAMARDRSSVHYT